MRTPLPPRTKDVCRRLMRQRRESLPAALHGPRSLRLTAWLLTLRALLHAPVAAVFASLPGEFDTGPLIRRLHALGRQIAFPRHFFDAARGLRSLTMHLASPDSLVPGPLGIPIPPPHAPPVALGPRDAVIVPGLAFTLTGGRLGYGKGYYDRFLATCPATRIGVCFEFQVRQFPSLRHDVPVQWLVTDAGIRYCHRQRPGMTPRLRAPWRAPPGAAKPERNGPYPG